MRIMIAGLVVGMVLVASGVHADPIIDPPPETEQEASLNVEYNTLLREGRYAELDQTMNQIQQDYESGKRDDINLMHLFRAFYDINPTLEQNFNAWIEAFPNSYAAYEARGIYYRRVGYDARGSDYVNKTPQEQMATMQLYIQKAMQDHKVALKLTAKPILTCFDILSLAKLDGARQLADAMLAVANKIDPKNFIVRYKYMLMLETRWGGSLAQMQKFREECRIAGLSAPQLQYLDELISSENSWLAKNGKAY